MSYLNKFLLENANVKSTSTISLPICFRAIDLKNGALDNFEKEISKEWKEKFKDEEENFEFGFESEI